MIVVILVHLQIYTTRAMESPGTWPSVNPGVHPGEDSVPLTLHLNYPLCRFHFIQGCDRLA